MEYRAWVRVPGIDVEGEDAHRLLAELERRFGHLGPVMSGAGNGVDVILATDGIDEAAAARELYAAVTDALHASGRGDLYPVEISVEPAEAEPALA